METIMLLHKAVVFRRKQKMNSNNVCAECGAEIKKNVMSIYYPMGKIDVCGKCLKYLKEKDSLIWVDEVIYGQYVRGWIYPRESFSLRYATWAWKYLSYREVAEDYLSYLSWQLARAKKKLSEKEFEREDFALWDKEAERFVEALGTDNQVVDHLIVLSPHLRWKYEMGQYPFKR